MNISQRSSELLKNSLEKCTEIASSEHEFTMQEYEKGREILTTLLDSVSQINLESTDSKSQDFSNESELDSIVDLLKDEFETIYGLKNSLDKKFNQLSKFTVTLFGRTMVGKSTLREAITNDSGETIGKGSQRTTRDIHEYEWNQLRLIDTPGISAVDGEIDSLKAHDIVDESDVIFFLTNSDGVQESSFVSLSRLRKQNKPIIFLLNVKEDITPKVIQRRFLKNPNRVFGESVVRGHKNRIRKLANEKLGMCDIHIIVFHAQAAFNSTKEQDIELAQKLREASGIEKIIDTLVSEVCKNGPVRRLQSFLDGTITEFEKIKEFLFSDVVDLKSAVKLSENLIKELENLRDIYSSKKVKLRIKSEIESICRPLDESVATFIENYLDSPDIKKQWKRHCSSMRIDKKVENFVNKYFHEINNQFHELSKYNEFEFELISSFHTDAPEQYDPWDTKQNLKWTSAIAGGVGSVAIAAPLLKIGAVNFWNPVGLVALGIGLGTLISSWFTKDKEKKIQKQKSKYIDQIREQIDIYKHETVKQVYNYYLVNINPSIDKYLDNIIARRTMTEEIVIAFEEAISQFEERLDRLNSRLILKTGELMGFETNNRKFIRKLVRDRGYKTKLLWEINQENAEYSLAVSSALHEPVDEVVYNKDQKQMVIQAFSPAKLDASMVSIENGRVNVTLPASEINKAMGFDNRNVNLVTKLLDLQTEIQTKE